MRRVSDWEVRISGAQWSISVGLFVLALFKYLLKSNGPDPRFLSNIIDASQSLAIKLFPGEAGRVASRGEAPSSQGGPQIES